MKLANARPGTTQRPHNRITAEDVNEASAGLSAEKQNDLHLDSGPDAEVVHDRLASLVRFCLDFNQTNVFLVDGAAMNETTWGQEIESLADLRLLHEIGNTSIQSSDYRGRRFVAFTLDLSHYTGTRSEHIRQIEFSGDGEQRDATSRPHLSARLRSRVGRCRFLRAFSSVCFDHSSAGAGELGGAAASVR